MAEVALIYMCFQEACSALLPGQGFVSLRVAASFLPVKVLTERVIGRTWALDRAEIRVEHCGTLPAEFVVKFLLADRMHS